MGEKEFYEYIQQELHHIGVQQLTYIHSILLSTDVDSVVGRLQPVEENILRNIECMYGGGERIEDHSESNWVNQYRAKLYLLIYGKIPCTPETINEIDSLYRNDFLVN